MARTRARSMGRRGGEGERFAYLPESVMQHPALATAPHAAFRYLAVLLVGKPKERNGLLMASDSYAAKFGMDSHDTISRARRELKERGLIVCTRAGMKLRMVPALWGVTWWPLYYREGQPLEKPEEATHAYRNYTPTIGVDAAVNITELHPDYRGNVTPAIGVEAPRLHPDGRTQRGVLHPDYRGNSRVLGGVQSLADKVTHLMCEQPHLLDSDISRATSAPVEFVSALRIKQHRAASAKD